MTCGCSSGRQSPLHTATPLHPDRDVEVRFSEACLAQEWPRGPATLSIISISQLLHGHWLSMVEMQPNLMWHQSQSHCSQTLPMKWGAGRGVWAPTPHLTWGAQALQALPNSHATSKSLLCSCQETGILQHGLNQKKRKDLEMTGMGILQELGP